MLKSNFVSSVAFLLACVSLLGALVSGGGRVAWYTAVGGFTFVIGVIVLRGNARRARRKVALRMEERGARWAAKIVVNENEEVLGGRPTAPPGPVGWLYLIDERLVFEPDWYAQRRAGFTERAFDVWRSKGVNYKRDITGLLVPQWSVDLPDGEVLFSLAARSSPIEDVLGEPGSPSVNSGPAGK